MGVIRWFCELIRSTTSPVLPPVLETRPGRIECRRVRSHPWIVGSLFVCGIGIPVSAWSGDLSEFRQVEFQDTHVALPVVPASSRSTVAAGFGFQNADSSTITVKTYDAQTGEILSDESYDLNVKEDGTSTVGQPRERIFAGGVGAGQDGLSDFTLRVYDAATGRFLWEGRLNLSSTNNEAGSTHRVVAHLQQKAAVRTARRLERMNGQPSFLLRAIDPMTGQLVWADQFSAGPGTVPRIDHIKAGVVGQVEDPAAFLKNFDFRIRMFDDQNRQMLWEDTIAPSDETDELSLGRESEADMLPVWSGLQKRIKRDLMGLEKLPHSAEKMERTATL